MLANHRYVGQNGKQNAMFPLEYMYITQGENGSFSHLGTYAIDFQGWGANGRILLCSYYAPCDMTLVAISDSTNHGYVYTSNNEVNFIDGSSGYLTLLVAHDNDNYNVGRTVNQGQFLGKTGTTSQVGDHVHMEAKKGNYEGIVKNSQGVWQLKNSTHIYNLLGVDDTVLVEDYNYNWRSYGIPPIPPTPTETKKRVFPWVLYARKLRQK